MKKLMLLGGIRYLLPVIKTAHKMGVYVITADYLPNNIAHKYSDEYVNVSILDREAVLKVAREKKIDGILSFGVDLGVVTAAYVAEKMGLPSPPLSSVEILQNKDKFRDFLAKNGFNCPWHISLNLSHEEHGEHGEDSTRSTRLNIPSYPCIVKPVDSAGSKGCTRVNGEAELPDAIEAARSESHNGRIIIEQFLELSGRQSGSDCFCVDNQLVYCTWGSQFFDSRATNVFAPIANTWPSALPQQAQEELTRETQRLIKLLNLGTTIFNIEARVATDGKAYIMELSPRGGGNCIAEVLRCTTGQDLIEANVVGALGFEHAKNLKLTMPQFDGQWAYYVIHSCKSGKLKGVEIDKSFQKKHVRHFELLKNLGDDVPLFTGANCALGFLFLRFDTFADLDLAMAHQDDWIKVEVA